MIDKEHIEEHLNRKDRKFYFADKVTYIERQDITVQSGGVLNNGPEADRTKIESSAMDIDSKDTVIIDRLKKCCYGDANVAATFLSQIRGMKSVEITALVHEYVGAKKISEFSAHRDLWSILHDYGLYKGIRV